MDPTGTPPTPDAPASASSLWAPEYRQLVVGLTLTVTLVAFEALAVATVMPDVKDDLGGLALYGWVFSGFFLASLLGIVVAGELIDRRGLVAPYVLGLSMFTVGLLVGGAATSMPMLVVGRILQGFGAGAIPAASYAAIARGVPDRLRPKMFAVLSTAWVIPGVVGPSAALLIEAATTWRAVFLALVPLVVVAGVLTLPALRARSAAPASAGDDPEGDAGRGRGSAARLRGVAVLVAAAGACFAAGTAGSAAVAVVLVGVGLPVGVLAARRLLPDGTFRLRGATPAAVGVRGLLTFTFFSADAYVPLLVVDGRGADSWIAGAALTLCTLLWSAGSWLQARTIERVGPRRLDRSGFATIGIGVAVLLAVTAGAPVLLTIPAWGLAGLGIGMAYAPLAVTVLGGAAAGEEGAASAAIQLSDGLGIALGTGLAGALVGLGDGRGWAVDETLLVVFTVSGLGALLGAAASGRLPRRVPTSANA